MKTIRSEQKKYSKQNRLTSEQRQAFLASWLGWTLDSFDYFLLIIASKDIQVDFHISDVSMTYLVTVTLLMRPVGAYIFGIWADKKGRTTPLLCCVLMYSFMGFFSAFSTSFGMLLVFRLLFGLAMGGEWGLGSALTMEKVPAHKRGWYSGLLQGGYASGYLIASLFYVVLHSYLNLSWRYLFICSIFPAIISIFIRLKVKESAEWVDMKTRMEESGTSIKKVFFQKKILSRFVYLMILMFAFTSLSHGAQDLYPKFLHTPFSMHQGAGVSVQAITWIPVIYNIAAIFGAAIFGVLADKIGKSATIIWASLLAMAALPIFSYDHRAGMLCLGSALVQLFTQGAWASVPAFLNEKSPPEIRGFYPGVTYQLGSVLSAFNLPIQQKVANIYGYPTAFTVFICGAAILIIIMIWMERFFRDHKEILLR